MTGWYATQEILSAVVSRFSKRDVRQLCSENDVVAASIETYSITAELDITDSVIEGAILQQALENTQAYVNKVHVLESTVSKSALDAASTWKGVNDVDLKEFTNIVTDLSSAPYCTSITITAKVR